jgi:energy-coupling factor transporter ATP-binding protein EcfA2
MSDALTLIYNACDPNKPATPQYYYDCAEARGAERLTQRFLGHLKRADDYLCFLFSGHIGCGKSSELEHLRHTLKHATPFQPRYFPILINASEYLWEKLARLDLSPDQKIVNGDEDYLKMLENLSVLEYVNGGDEDPLALAEPWYAVNPIVRELQKFKEAKVRSQQKWAAEVI